MDKLVERKSKGEAASRPMLLKGVSVITGGGANRPASVLEIGERVGWCWGVALLFH